MDSYLPVVFNLSEIIWRHTVEDTLSKVEVVRKLRCSSYSLSEEFVARGCLNIQCHAHGPTCNNTLEEELEESISWNQYRACFETILNATVVSTLRLFWPVTMKTVWRRVKHAKVKNPPYIKFRMQLLETSMYSDLMCIENRGRVVMSDVFSTKQSV